MKLHIQTATERDKPEGEFIEYEIADIKLADAATLRIIVRDKSRKGYYTDARGE